MGLFSTILLGQTILGFDIVWTCMVAVVDEISLSFQFKFATVVMSRQSYLPEDQDFAVSLQDFMPTQGWHT